MKQWSDEYIKEFREIDINAKTWDILYEHGRELIRFIRSLDKKKAWKKKLKVDYHVYNVDSTKPLVLIKKNGNVVFRNIYDLHFVAEECFERGVAFLADECRHANKAGEIVNFPNEEDGRQFRQFFIERIEKTENLLHNRPVANLKFETKHFEEVDDLVSTKSYKQTSALDEVALKYRFNRDSFEKQYRKRHLNEKRKAKPIVD